jgi:hypothetical protein
MWNVLHVTGLTSKKVKNMNWFDLFMEYKVMTAVITLVFLFVTAPKWNLTLKGKKK